MIFINKRRICETMNFQNLSLLIVLTNPTFSMKRNSFVTVLIAIYCTRIQATITNDVTNKLKEENGTIISRKRRYLVFPEGSSFQIVFDLTYPAVAIEGNVFMFGHTAAMAWELPSTPIFLDKKKINKEEKKLEPATTAPDVEHLNFEYPKEQDWKPTQVWDYPGAESQLDWLNNIDRSSLTYYKNPFQRFINPYFFHDKSKANFWNDQKIIKFPQPVRRSVANHIHRKSRRELYNKIEKLLSSLSKDGKTCVLKAICQVSQLPSKKGTLWEEIVKTIFRAKHGMYSDEDHYDRAANKRHDCEKMYPNCHGHVLSNLFKKKATK